MAPVRFTSQADFDATRALLNERLLLSGFRVLEDGKVARARAAVTLDETQRRADDLRAELSRRDVHPDVLRFCRAEPLQQNYFHAVLEASKSVADKLRGLTRTTGDGSPLVDATCSLGSGPRIALNSLATEWERSEQTGIATLLKGLFRTFRYVQLPRAQGGLGHLTQGRSGHAHPRVHAAPPAGRGNGAEV